MAQKTKKEDTFKEFFKKTAIPTMIFKVKHMVEEATKKIQESVEHTVSFTIKKISALALILFGIIFLLFGLGKIIEAMLFLPSGMGFIIIGLVVMIIGFVINTFAKR